MCSLDGSLGRVPDGKSTGLVTSLGRAGLGAIGAYVELHHARWVKKALKGYTKNLSPDNDVLSFYIHK